MDKRILISGKKLADARRARFLTQEELGQRVDMAGGSIRRLEGQEPGGMYLKNFRKLAEAFKVEPERLKAEIGAEAAGDQTSYSGIADTYELTGLIAVALTTKALARGRRPMDFLVTLLSLPDEKLDRALPPGFRVPVEPHGGNRIAAADRVPPELGEEGRDEGKRGKGKPKGKE